MTAPYPATERQQAALRFIHGYQLAHGGMSPTVREIAAGIGSKGIGATHDVLCELEGRGKIRRLCNRNRAIEVLHAPSIPRAPDGEPLNFVPVGERSQCQ